MKRVSESIGDIPSWAIAFFVVCMILRGGLSVAAAARRSGLFDVLLTRILRGCSESSLSVVYNFLSDKRFDWFKFDVNRLRVLQRLDVTRLKDGDVICIDDTVVPRPNGKKLSIFKWLREPASGLKVLGYNLVTLSLATS